MQNDTVMVKDIKEHTRTAVGLLKDMIAVPSPSFAEDAARHLISSFLTDNGISHVTAGNNIIAVNRHFNPGLRSLMLNAHIDTVPPSDDYSFDPYTPDYTIAGQCIGSGDVVCGLGSNDDGASVVSLTSAFMHYYEMQLPVNLILVLSCEEERSGKGGMELVWKEFPGILERLSGTVAGRPGWAIIGEPTGMKAAVSERGLLVIDACAHGTSGHAAREDGENALYIAIDDICKLRKHNFGRISPVMGEVRMNVTMIEAGTAHNVIPDRCSFVIDIRPTEMYRNEEILLELQDICRSTLAARNLGNRSSATADGSVLVSCAGELGIGTFSSPTTSDWMRIGCDAIKMGPGDSLRSHRKDEFVYISEIEEAIGTYIEFIDRFCLSVKSL